MNINIQLLNNNKISSYPSTNKGLRTGAVQNSIHPQINALPNFYYPPVNFVNHINFKGQWFEDNYTKKVTNKTYQGTGLMKKNVDGQYAWYDFNKVGWKYLSQEPLDWKEAKSIKKDGDEADKKLETEFYVFQQANALAETNDTTWVKRFNNHNVKKMLATNHSIDSREAKEPPAINLYDKPVDDLSFANNLRELMNLNKHKNLDKPITDENGKLDLDAVVFDTETTGTNNDNFSKPLDKIIQIGAIQIKNGEIDSKTGYSQLINPNMHISEGASAVNHITDDVVKDKPTIGQILPTFVNDYLNKKNGVLVAYNGKFDLKMLNNSIKEHNKFSDNELQPIKYCNMLDPFLLTQRIHPYVGARKRLSEQYKFFFCKNMDDAHDAYADVRGTVNMLKYDLYYLSEHRKDKTKPLTIRDVLFFQNGVIPPNLNMKLDHQGCNAEVNKDMSNRCDSVNVDHYFTGYKITSETLNKVGDLIGSDNVKKIKNNELIDEKIDLSQSEQYPGNPPETALKAKTGGIENAFYVMKDNFMKVLDSAKIDAYNDKSKEDIKNILADNSKEYVNEDSVDLWMKNPNPKDIKDGNDLPDYKISKRVMLEEIDEKEKEKKLDKAKPESSKVSEATDDKSVEKHNTTLDDEDTDNNSNGNDTDNAKLKDGPVFPDEKD